MLEESEADDAVVCAAVEGEGCRTGGGRLVEDAIYAVGIEDFVDA